MKNKVITKITMIAASALMMVISLTLSNAFSSMAIASQLETLTLGTETQAQTSQFKVTHQTIEVDGVEIFYREAGTANAPTIILLQEQSTSSRNLLKFIPRLSGRFHVLAPSYPEYADIASSAENLANLMSHFVKQKGVSQYGLLVQYKSSPIAVRMTLQNPQYVQFFIVQNGDKYEDRLADLSNSIQRYWENRNPQKTTTMGDFNHPVDVTINVSNMQFTESKYSF